MDHVELKNLQTQITKSQTELDGAKQEREQVGQKVTSINNRLQSLQSQVDRLTRKKKNVVVSEHAILRYLERVHGVDIEALKQEIMPDSIKDSIETVGSGRYPVNGTHTLLVKQFVVSTILTKEPKEPKEPKNGH